MIRTLGADTPYIRALLQWSFALALSLLLISCGRPDTNTGNTQAAPQAAEATATVVTTPAHTTHTPDIAVGATADALKQAELDRIQHEVATAQVQPTPITREML